MEIRVKKFYLHLLFLSGFNYDFIIRLSYPH